MVMMGSTVTLKQQTTQSWPEKILTLHSDNDDDAVVRSQVGGWTAAQSFVTIVRKVLCRPVVFEATLD